MDDNLETPSFPPPRQQEESAEFSGDEDEGPDWTKFKSFASSSKLSLPKRGDKEFEPAIDGPTNLQTHSLNRARDAMFGALDAERGISKYVEFRMRKLARLMNEQRSKSVSYAVWYPDLARAQVTQSRGVLFNGMGHSVPRPIAGNPKKTHKRTELLPEETIYLIERGSLFCWKDEPKAQLRTRSGEEVEEESDEEHDMRGSPMSVQQAYAEMIGRDDLTLECYHAFAYLKRLGFNVLRTKPPTPSYPTPVSVIVSRSSQSHLLSQIFKPLTNIFSRLKSWMFGAVDWWKPLSFEGWIGCARNYQSMYRSLRIIPSGHNINLYSPLPVAKPPPPPNTISDEHPTPYEIFYNVYKPNTPFRKSAPPPPDFSLVVVNARTTPLPSIHELTYLWSFLPETGPPLPRQRVQPKTPPKSDTPRSSQPPLTPSSSSLVRLLSRLLGRNRNVNQNKGPPPRRPHPFAVLKGGKKTIVIGVVDSGTVGFFRFGMGAFEEMPMI